ncbi:hypothetical protein N9J71_03090, partial [Ascidiaceihabitans sp.]
MKTMEKFPKTTKKSVMLKPHLVINVKKFIKYYYLYAKYIRFIDFNIKIHNSEVPKTILLVSHDMANSGAPILLLHIAKSIKKLGWNIIVVSKCSGPLVQEFAKISQIYICKTPAKFDKKIHYLVEKNVTVSLLNSVISGDWAGYLRKNGFRVISLVHELPGAIEAWGAIGSAKNISRNSHIIVFPSTFVEEKFEQLVGVTATPVILPQGLYLKPIHKIDRPSAKKFIDDKFMLSGKPIVLNVATGNYRKGFDLFVKMATLDSSFNFIWVGDVDKDILVEVSEKYKLNCIPNLHLLGYITS